MSKTITPLSEVGLFGLMERYEKTFSSHRRSMTIKGLENDAAIISQENASLITGQNILLEGIHFDLTYFPLKHLGYKSVVSAISEIIATGSRPSHISLALGLSGKMSLEAVDQFMEGVKTACDKYNLDLIGFKPSSSLTGMTISVTAYGFSKSSKPISRSGAKETDLLCVTGDLGSAFMGLQLLEREKKVLKETGEAMPDFGSYDYLLERQIKPEARIELLEQLEATSIRPTSMCLIREGLAPSLIRLCKSSKVGCIIFENKIPIDHTTSTLCDEMEFNPLVAALNGGEDYELLFTLSLDDYQKVEDAKDKLNNVFLIGHIWPESKGYILETNAGQEIPLKARGWGKEDYDQ
ncbi:thiamine-phosphate kinase [Thermophagus xiamenensis]|uniref:Thiamine-monophosphate kinase n=1 Tax=Thermophagus xiamenensis TaxID=385682 RepID=A0A1I1Y4H9_9BACT|nr:thiamine-phosphate kinase [Thermophagus xiamenensis]SFE14585.1 thiamine-phosphate kinase [Thermophagus xiamenensis]